MTIIHHISAFLHSIVLFTLGPLGWEDSLEEGMATHSNILSWKTPWTADPGGVAKSQTQLKQLSRDTWKVTAQQWEQEVLWVKVPSLPSSVLLWKEYSFLRQFISSSFSSSDVFCLPGVLICLSRSKLIYL